eukprot:TRINITY_DN79067_c0_g1_i1.p1 TRINITY_DN79067_c0_g1~~TRINITY_DN79067_c0_g1_i1.p1  ORF type:complete len:336 (+),score=50.92 TRINITY_DN79067_c0_g1_i1:26-1009(+)
MSMLVIPQTSPLQPLQHYSQVADPFGQPFLLQAVAVSQTCRARHAVQRADSRQRVRCRGFNPLHQVPPVAVATQAEKIERPLPLPQLGHMPVSFFAPTGGTANAAKCRLLCYGDSLTAGFCEQGRFFEPYGRNLAAALCAALGVPSEVHVCGHSGHTAAQMVSNLDCYAVTDAGNQLGKGLRRCLDDAARRPELVLIMAGTNDLGLHYQPRAILQDIAKLHKVCHLQGVPTVALCPPPIVKNLSIEASRRVLCDLISAWARSAPNVLAAVDTERIVPSSSPGAWDADLIHFSPNGSRLLGQQLVGKVLPYLQPISKAMGSIAHELDN